MTQVSFYALSSSDQESRHQFACRLAEKALHLGHRVFIQVESAEHARQIDSLLWHFKPSSFLPHAIAQQGEAGAEALMIGTKDSQAQFQDVFINLSSEPCQHSQRDLGCAPILNARDDEVEHRGG